jgi:glycosyltransferase involved in cell wall biosynthesis
MRRRILFTSHTAAWMGPTNSLLLLMEHLRSTLDVAVAVPGEGEFVEVARGKGLEVVQFPSLTKWALPALTRHVRAGDYDLVYGNNTRGSSRNSFIAARLAGTPFACHVRSMDWDAAWSTLWYLRQAVAVIAVSEACADSVRRFVRDGRLHVVHNGVPLEPALDGQTEDVRREVRSELGLPADALVVLSVSHLCERKAQHLAVEALARVSTTLPQARLVLLGARDREPEYTRRVEAMIRDLDLAGRVVLPGFRRDVHRMYAAADLLVHTALADPHPRAVVEAMAAGLPVAAFATDGVAETVVDGETGRLMGKGDVDGLAVALADLGQDAAIRRRMGEAGRDRARTTFSAEAAAEGVRKVLEAVWKERHAAA